ncbi:MAG TPA: hypothetical protein PLU22_14005 [Polyangiaceae bacterium]|nr:hypothetical protein [Polyangiaceae bacterium]
MDGVQRAQARGNHVRAALARARVEGPAAGAPLLEPLLARLAASLELDGEARQRWAALLPCLLPGAVAHGRRWRERLTPEAGALWDLQRLAVAASPAASLDLVGWLRSAGRRPMVRPRPARDAVRLVQRLGAVARRLDRARHDPEVATTLADALLGAAERGGERFRAAYRDRVDAALEEAGLAHRGEAERAARRAVAERLLDVALARGTVEFGDLRDAIAHDQIKLADVASLRDLIGRDPLLRADEALAELLDGVYYRGEFYLRGLHRLQALLFGTRIGRLVSRLLLLPLGGSLLAVEFFGYLLELLGIALGLSRLPLALGLALAIGLLVNVPAARAALAASWGRLRRRAVDADGQGPDRVAPPPTARGGGPGGLLSSLASGIAAAYLDLITSVESLVHVVDEWLRYRGGRRRWAERLVAVGVLGWFLVGYGLRFVVRLIIEPSINPIKHFPVVTVAGKVSIATGIPLLIALGFAPLTGAALAGTLGFVLGVLVLPGICGFVAWEVRYEWLLFAANRRRHLPACPAGPGGEPLRRLLVPGVYSGALPETLQSLARSLAEDGPHTARVRRLERRRRRLVAAVERFFERELVARLAASSHLGGRVFDLRVGVDGTGVACALAPRGAPGDALVVELRVVGRDLAAVLGARGFAAALAPAERRVLDAALLGLAAAAGARRCFGAGGVAVPWERWAAFWDAERRGEPPPLLPDAAALDGGGA